MSASTIIGIDLGTTNSEVAVVVDGRIEILADADGSQMIPSYVGLDADGELVVGRLARNQYLAFPDRTIRSIKRKMGSDAAVSLGEQTYSPAEISALILGHLKRLAEARLGHAVDKAVITVPAYFSDAQRQATRDAGALAGLEVVRILNEPTAACLAYEHGLAHDNEKTILAFDLGGGTFDVSIVHSSGDLVEVVASHGDNHLGGDDFDDRLADHFESALDCRDGLVDVAKNRLRRAAETAKMHLTDEIQAQAIEDHLGTESGAQLHLELTIDREEYEGLVTDLVDRAMDSVHRTLEAAKMRMADVDDVVLVGGATRMPMIQERLRALAGAPPRTDLHPDLAVAYGAGVMAARLMGRDDHRILVDVTPYTFGIACIGSVNGSYTGQCFSRVITAGTPLPATRSITVFTGADGQSEANADVYQGEADHCDDNVLVGKFRITGFSDELPEGSPVVIRMDLDVDGILHCTAIEKETGTTCSIALAGAVSNFNRDQLADAKKRLAELAGQHLAEPQSAALVEARKLEVRLKSALKQLDGVDREDGASLLDRLRQAIAAEDEAEIPEIAQEVDDLLFYADVD